MMVSARFLSVVLLITFVVILVVSTSYIYFYDENAACMKLVDNCTTKTRAAVDATELALVTDLITKWDNAVTKQHDSVAVTSLFCDEAELWGTKSSDLRTTHPEIKSYFDYFATKGHEIEKSCSFVSQSADGVYTDFRSVKWNLDGSDVCARMEFETVMENGKLCIKSLHSSVFPDPPQALVNADKMNKVL